MGGWGESGDALVIGVCITDGGGMAIARDAAILKGKVLIRGVWVWRRMGGEVRIAIDAVISAQANVFTLSPTTRELLTRREKSCLNTA